VGGSELCESNDDCSADAFCKPGGYACDDDFDDTCTSRPSDCSSSPTKPVCGCDGVVYESRCAAEAAGVGTTLYNSSCTPPAGTFSCGNTFCTIDQEICVEQLEVMLDCFAYPQGCDPSAPSCATCTPEDLPGNCSCSDAEGFTITCT